MRFTITEKWFAPAMCFFSVLLVHPLYAAAGQPSPLQAPGFFWGVALLVVNTWGIMFALGSVVAMILRSLLPDRFNPERHAAP